MAERFVIDASVVAKWFLQDGLEDQVDLAEEGVRMSVAANMALLDSYDETIDELELYLENRAKVHDDATFYLLRSIPGIGKIPSIPSMVPDVSQVTDGRGVPQRGAIPKPRVSAAPPWVLGHRRNNPERVA